MAGITIPRYDGAQVKSIGIQAPRAQAIASASPLVGLGQNLQQVGQQMGEFEQKQQQQKLQTQAYEHSVGLSDLVQTARFGTPGNENIEGQEPTSFEGFLSIKGSEAMQYKDTYLEDFKQKALDGIPKDLPEHYRIEFEKMAMSKYYEVANEFNRHAVTEEGRANDAATGAMRATLLRDMGDGSLSEQGFQIKLEMMKHVVNESIKKDMGEDNPNYSIVNESAQRLAVSDSYSKRLDTMLLNDPTQAQKYLTENTGNGTLTDDAINKYKKIIVPLVANQDGINKAFEFIPRLKAGEPVDDLVAEMQKGLSSRPEVFKVAEAQLRAAQNDIHNARVQGAQAAAMPVQKLMMERGYDLTPAELLSNPEYKKLLALGTPEAMTLANGYSNEVLREHRQKEADERREERDRRMEGKVDKAAARQERINEQQLEFTRLSLAPDEVAGMSGFELGQKVIELGPSLGGQLRKKHADMTSPEKLAQVKLENKTFTSLMTSLGITNKSKQSQYYAAAQDYLVAQQQEGKRVFSPDQMRKAIVGAFQDVEVSTMTKDFFGDGYSDSGTVKKKRIDVQNPEAIIIPKDDLKMVTAFLKANNFDDTPKNRLRVYDRLLSDRGGKKIKGAR